MQIKELQCKTILTPTTLASIDFTINPYFGCSHGCVYCYCRELSRRFRKHAEPWGSYVDVKTNAAEALQKQLKSNPRGIVWLSSATDAYQPVEGKYELTRKILELLLASNLQISILSKGALVTRDIELFKKFGSRIDVGFTINTLDDSFRKEIEPGAAPVKKRIDQLFELRDAGVPVSGSFGPVWPEFTDAEQILKVFKEAGAASVFTESFNARGENWTEIKRVLEQKNPALLAKYEDIFFNRKEEWHAAEEKKIKEAAKKLGVKCETYFHFRDKFK